jgi:1-acyl-sn-glycerol-3-phosphate acyltransferase
VFYQLLKAYARLAIRLYCRRIVINRPECLEAEGPLLLAANHPNSFLDGIILTTLLEHDLYSLARGDAFRKGFVDRTLRRLHLLPVYRTSEGVENLEHNYTTFEACLDVFRKKAIVLIFSEGGCVNEWKLRPLRKGTARLAMTAWSRDIPLKVLPLGINYNSFRSFGKEVHLHFGESFGQEVVAGQEGHGRQLLSFNAAVQSQLKDLVYQADEDGVQDVKQKFAYGISPSTKALLLLPALLGLLLHAPFFFPIKLFTRLRFSKSEHYDSVETALLMLGYPFYILLAALLLSNIHIALGLSVIFMLPLSARALAKTNWVSGL